MPFCIIINMEEPLKAHGTMKYNQLLKGGFGPKERITKMGFLLYFYTPLNPQVYLIHH